MKFKIGDILTIRNEKYLVTQIYHCRIGDWQWQEYTIHKTSSLTPNATWLEIEEDDGNIKVVHWTDKHIVDPKTWLAKETFFGEDYTLTEQGGMEVRFETKNGTQSVGSADYYDYKQTSDNGAVASIEIFVKSAPELYLGQQLISDSVKKQSLLDRTITCIKSLSKTQQFIAIIGLFLLVCALVLVLR